MISEIIIGIASFLGATATPEFFEQKAVLTAGENIIATEESWNAMTLFTLDGSPLPEICYQVAPQKDCIDWHNAEEVEGHALDLLDLLYFNELRSDLILQSDGEQEVGIHFFNTTSDHRIESADLAENSQEYFDDNLSKSFRAAGQVVPRFFSRAEWGAEGDGRIASRFEQFFKPKRWTVFGEEKNSLSVSLQPKLTQTKDKEGNTLYWPMYENPELRKFIIHHTGEALEGQNQNRSNFEIVRAIEKYHSYTRNWGDIGYNYLIDKQGNIYEGRAGGPTTLGAHTWGHNSLSLGISLMGNFQYEEPTEAQINVLSLLLADHALRFGIDPTQQSDFLGKNSFNIAGHRDVARVGHGTACPGENMVARLPDVRIKTAEFMRKIAKYRGGPSARDFLGQSIAAPKVLADTKFKREEKPAPAEFGSYGDTVLLNRGGDDQVQIRVKNNTEEAWPILSEIVVKNIPDGLLVSKFRNPRPIRPNQTGVFRGTIKAESVKNGTYYLSFWPEFLEGKFFDLQLQKSQLQLPVTVSGSQSLWTESSTNLLQANSMSQTTIKKPWAPPSLQKKAPVAATVEPVVKIKLADFSGEYIEVVADKTVSIYSGETLITTTSPGNSIKVYGQNGVLEQKIRLEINQKKWELGKLRIDTNGGTFVINNYRSARFGQGRIKYNQFRGNLSVYNDGGKKLLLVNELPLEQYLWGLAEEPKTEPIEKQIAVHILARTYAYVYSTGPRRKFQTYLYDLENDPRTSQLYLGREWENYHANQKNILTQSEGEIVTYKGEAVIAPYFTQSAGHSSDAWASQYPWAKVQPLPYDEGLEAKGHGVGLSGNSARVLAEQGKTHEEIIDYFFEGVAVEKKY